MRVLLMVLVLVLISTVAFADVQVSTGVYMSSGEYGTGYEIALKAPVGPVELVAAHVGGLGELYSDSYYDASVDVKADFLGVGKTLDVGKLSCSAAVGVARSAAKFEINDGENVFSESESDSKLGYRIGAAYNINDKLSASVSTLQTGFKETSGYMVGVNYKVKL